MGLGVIHKYFCLFTLLVLHFYYRVPQPIGAMMAEEIVGIEFSRQLDASLERSLPPHFAGRRTRIRAEHVCREWLAGRAHDGIDRGMGAESNCQAEPSVPAAGNRDE